MPEGDTVWLVCKRLDDALSGDVLTRSDFRVPQLATTDLVGRRVLSTVPRGKHLLTRLEGGLTLHTHLRMDGMWHLYRPGTPWHGGPDHQIRLILSTQAWDAVGYRLPVVDLLATSEEATVVGHLGPDLLSPDYDRDEALARLAADPDREIGVALLDQSSVAGIGNMYKDEVLFVRRTSPFTHVGAVDDLGAILDQAQKYLAGNRDHAAQITTGDPRRGYEHWVYGRGSRPCRRCGTRLRQARQGTPPTDRLTTWCPSCQPGPAR
ncbi:MAG TPA: DNA-formamidopyrimidine glycosylase family protein [Candidatus Nanopelagicales bacterium]|nr:DNA-formamidopyrimidine glycosylase family protein [Candidatus Nanopelagicales bacterium]